MGCGDGAVSGGQRARGEDQRAEKASDSRKQIGGTNHG